MLIPLKDDNPTRRTPVVLYTLVGINVLVYLFELLIQVSGDYRFYNYIISHYALIPANIFQGSVSSSVVPFFSSIFMHGGLLHLGGNMLFLWVFGDNIESELGHGKFLAFYLLCGVGASLTQIAIDWHSTAPIIGASGAISGVLGAYYHRFPRAQVLAIFIFFLIWIPAKFILGFWFAIQIFSGLSSVGVGGGGVAWFAHIGGFIIGIVLFNLMYHYRPKVYG